MWMRRNKTKPISSPLNSTVAHRKILDIDTNFLPKNKKNSSSPTSSVAKRKTNGCQQRP